MKNLFAFFVIMVSFYSFSRNDDSKEKEIESVRQKIETSLKDVPMNRTFVLLRFLSRCARQKSVEDCKYLQQASAKLKSFIQADIDEMNKRNYRELVAYYPNDNPTKEDLAFAEDLAKTMWEDDFNKYKEIHAALEKVNQLAKELSELVEKSKK